MSEDDVAYKKSVRNMALILAAITITIFGAIFLPPIFNPTREQFALSASTTSPYGFTLDLQLNTTSLRAGGTLEIMAWEMVEPNPLTAALAAVREQRSLAVMDRVMARFPDVHGVDVAALLALVGAATNYLVIRERGVRYFQGLDLCGDGWERLFAALERVAEAILSA